MWNVGFSVQAAADQLEWIAEKSEYSAPPACSLFMLTSQMGLPKHQTSLRNAFPIQKKQQDKDKQIICQAPGHKRSPESRKLPKRAAGICLIGRATRYKHQLHHHTPLSPPSLSCMQIGLNIVVPHCRAVGTGFADMSRVREGIKKTNAWKEEGIGVSLVQNHS